MWLIDLLACYWLFCGWIQYFTNSLCMEASIAKGETMDKVMSIMDLHGLGFRQLTNNEFLTVRAHSLTHFTTLCLTESLT